MSVQVTDTPYAISWARNRNVLTLLCGIGTRQNYAIAAKVTVWANNNNVVTVYQSETMVLHPDTQGYVHIPLDLLGGFAPQPDMPDGEVFSLMTNAVLKYQVRYAEMYGSPMPIIRTWNADIIRYAICGEVAERYARLNMPDWKSGVVLPMAESGNLFWVIGEDTAQSVQVRKSQPVYLYGIWYRDTGSASTLTVTETVAITTATGTTSNTYSRSVTNGSMYRLDVSPSKVGATDALYYTVTLSASGYSWSRTFVVAPDGWRDIYLLLQNKYGLLVPWVCPDMKRELTLESETLKVGRLHYNDQTESYEKYTAMMPSLTNAEAARLARCIGQQYNYIRSGYAWLRIEMEPETFTVLEEQEGMVRVKFSFRFVENQLENMSEAPRTAGMSFNYNDNVNEEYVAFSDRTIPSNNELYD